MARQTLVKRHLKQYGIDLEWDGKVVRMKNGDHVIQEEDAWTGWAAGRLMKKMERECDSAATAMC